MKSLKLLFYVFIVGTITLVSCSKGNTPSDTGGGNNGGSAGGNNGLPAGTKLASGSFASSAHPTSGTATVVLDSNGKRYLVIQSFDSDNGPDLRVWLSPNNNGSPYVEAGVLQVLNGSFYYELNSSTDIAQYNRVLIWCEDFSVLFGYAILQ
ncbi:MAG TPA: DM13 domain-containing protein [Chitinophagaceae bacterium]|nr:DM13 domain-containing protein [Chitinophagaceae bacterium]